MNFGRAISLQQRVKEMGGLSRRHRSSAAFLSSFEKLGKKDYLVAALFNPKLARYQKQITLLSKSEHDIGLHGGKNHDTWAKNASTWRTNKIKREINWGLKQFRCHFSRLPDGFASPGWESSSRVAEAVKNLGFKYLGDDHAPVDDFKVRFENGLLFPPTNLLAEPGGVAYFEHSYAMGMNDEEVFQDFFSQVEKRETTVVYDHPYLIGRRGLSLFEAILIELKMRNYRVETLLESVTK